MKLLKIISFPISILMLLLSFALYYYQNKWDKINLYLLIGAVAFLILSILLDLKKTVETFKNRIVKYSFTSLLAIILMLAILTVLNYLSYKHYKRFDMTQTKRFSLSPQTIQLLKTLPREVNIISFISDDNPLEMRKFNDLMKEFNTYTNKLKIEKYDLVLNPQIAQKYDVNIPGTIVFTSNKQQEKINKVSEEDIINAIFKVTKDIKKVVYFLEGHQEPDIDEPDSDGMSVFKERLLKENYEVKKLLLASTGKVPDDATVLIIAYPLLRLLDHEIQAIEDYAKKGGRLLIFADPIASKSLINLADKLGIKLEQSFIVDQVQSFFGGNPFNPQIRTIYGSPISKSFSLRCFFSYARSLSKIEDADKELIIEKIAESTENSWAEFNPEIAQFDENIDKTGPITVGYAVHKKEKDADKETRIIIYGDGDFVRNAWFNILGNGNLALNSVAWLAEELELISIKEKPEETAQLPFEAYELKKFMKFSQLIAPGIIVLIGLIVWMKRRKS